MFAKKLIQHQINNKIVLDAVKSNEILQRPEFRSTMYDVSLLRA